MRYGHFREEGRLEKEVGGFLSRSYQVSADCRACRVCPIWRPQLVVQKYCKLVYNINFSAL